MTVYEVRNGSKKITVEACSVQEAVLIAADELQVYDGMFDVFNCTGQFLFETYTCHLCIEPTTGEVTNFVE